jgi:hypothetical protein
MAVTASSPMSIDASPTKMLFIDMLTRDINLIPAILDLADNACDGARRERKDHSYKGLSIRIEISPDKFRIWDNCGGIDVDTARKYAFRFGRDEHAPIVKHSVGEFGVGMKRALFKLGRQFHIESKTATTSFVVDINVVKWAREPEWEFAFTSINENAKVDKDDRGTTIEVTDLKADVIQAFGPGHFESELKAELQSRLQDPISRGLAVTLNGVPANAEPLKILSDKRLIPAVLKAEYPEPKKKPVRVRLYCGLGASDDRAAAGWHVFCNGRLILEGDKSETTGWGEKRETTIPAFHPQYNHFRGYAYFDCDDAGRLPWNSTKTGLNTDSSVYRAALEDMMRLMRPVIDFLNRLKEEKERTSDSGDQGPLEKMLATSHTTSIDKAASRPVFEMPPVKPVSVRTGPLLQRIQYDRPLAKVQAVMAKLRVRSFVKVGEKTFDYFYKAEVEE